MWTVHMHVQASATLLDGVGAHRRALKQRDPNVHTSFGFGATFDAGTRPQAAACQQLLHTNGSCCVLVTKLRLGVYPGIATAARTCSGASTTLCLCSSLRRPSTGGQCVQLR